MNRYSTANGNDTMRMEGRKDFPYVVALSCSCGLTVVVRHMAVFELGVISAVGREELGTRR